MGWNEDFLELSRFYEEHGHCDVPNNYSKSPNLFGFIMKLRLTRRNLSNEQQLMLNSIDFRWNSHTPTWRDSFEKYRQFVEKSGKSDVPTGWDEDPQLAAWLETQKIAQRKGVLNPDRVKRLDELGINWGTDVIITSGDIWDRRYAELKSYRAQYGNCNVPVKWKKNKALGSWVVGQRQNMKHGKLPSDKIKLLEELQFDVGKTRVTPQANWETRFAELCDYKEKYGNCSVPRDWDKNPQLGSWVTSQKQYIRKGTLPREKMKRLEEIGFLDPEEGAGELGAADDWEDNFAALKSFKGVHGHCKVPIGWPDDPELGAWVMSQRLRLQTLPIERARRLRALGI